LNQKHIARTRHQQPASELADADAVVRAAQATAAAAAAAAAQSTTNNLIISAYEDLKIIIDWNKPRAILLDIKE